MESAEFQGGFFDKPSREFLMDWRVKIVIFGRKVPGAVKLRFPYRTTIWSDLGFSCWVDPFPCLEMSRVGRPCFLGVCPALLGPE
jgi:hypothetical protein